MIHCGRGLQRSEYTPLQRLPADSFTPTFELDLEDWPDFLAEDIADWPCRTRQTHPLYENGLRPDVALILAFPESLPPLSSVTDCIFLRHQTSGYRRAEFRCAAVKLAPSPKALLFGVKIATNWHGTAAGIAHTALDELIRYRSLLREQGLDCDHSYSHFAEGVYPIDFDDAAVDFLVSPESRGSVRLLQSYHGGCLAFLAPNSGSCA